MISFLFYFYEKIKESFEKEKKFKKHEMLSGICIPTLFTVVFMALYKVLFSVKDNYVLFEYGFCFFIFNACIFLLGYALVDDASDQKKRVIVKKRGKIFFRMMNGFSIVLLVATDILMVIFCAFMSGQKNEPDFTVNLLRCLFVSVMYVPICAVHLLRIYSYNVQYICGFESVTSQIFYERRYDTAQLRQLAKKIVDDSNSESIYIKLFISICDKHKWALYSEKRKLEKVMSSFAEAEKLEKVIACIEETKKLKKELKVLKKLFRNNVKLEEKKREFLEQVEMCDVE